MIRNSLRRFKIVYDPRRSEIVQKNLISFKMVHGLVWSEMIYGKDEQKWSKVVWDGPIWAQAPWYFLKLRNFVTGSITMGYCDDSPWPLPAWHYATDMVVADIFLHCSPLWSILCDRYGGGWCNEKYIVAKTAISLCPRLRYTIFVIHIVHKYRKYADKWRNIQKYTEIYRNAHHYALV